MLKSISFKKLAVLTAGLAIVLSSCGLQNEASESSGDETAAGKTKNYALTQSGACFDNVETWSALVQQLDAKWQKLNYGPGYQEEFAVIFPVGWPGNEDWNSFYKDLYNGELCPSGGIESLEIDDQSSTGSSAPVCVKSEIKQAMIDGYTEQLARPVGGEVTEAYLAAMQKGLDVANAMCTN